MQSEHLSNLHPGWVAGGWLAAVALTSAVYLGGIGLGLVPADGGALWLTVSIIAGFFGGGLFVGVRWTDAPILHGAAMTFISVVMWFLFALFGEPTEAFASLPMALGLILVQFIAAAVGGLAGRRVTLGRALGE